MDQLHRAASYSLSSLQDVTASIGVFWPTHQPSIDPDQVLYRNSFNGLAVQFAVLPYVQRRYMEYPDGFHPVPQKNSKPLLEQAIFGFERYSAPRIMHGVDGSRIPVSRRRDLVAFLLEQGAKQPGILVLMEQVKSSEFTYSSLDNRYYTEMRLLLEDSKAAVGNRKSHVIRRFGSKMKRWTGSM